MKIIIDAKPGMFQRQIAEKFGISLVAAWHARFQVALP